MEDNQVDLKTELESDTPPPPSMVHGQDSMHQFQEKGLHYKTNTKLFIAILVVVIVFGVGTHYFLNVDSGKQIVDNLLGNNQSETSSSQLPDSFATSSADSSNASQLPERLFADSNLETILDTVTTDVNNLSENYSGDKLFPNFDPEAEVGFPGQSGTTDTE